MRLSFFLSRRLAQRKPSAFSTLNALKQSTGDGASSITTGGVPLPARLLRLSTKTGPLATPSYATFDAVQRPGAHRTTGRYRAWAGVKRLTCQARATDGEGPSPTQLMYIMGLVARGLSRAQFSVRLGRTSVNSSMVPRREWLRSLGPLYPDSSLGFVAERLYEGCWPSHAVLPWSRGT